MNSFRTSSPPELWLRRLTLAGVVLCFIVVVLGAYVRLTAAGLGCPDWPGCYGHFTPPAAQQTAAGVAEFPTQPLDVGKAWREMVHRYAASTLVLVIVVIAALALTTRGRRIVSVPLSLALLVVVVLQGALGMLTVTWQLKPLIVTLHLLFGLTTLSLLWWLWLSLRASTRGGVRFGGAVMPGADHRTSDARAVRPLALIALVALGVQIALGGWTSSNYAAVACPDVPTCQQSWWPETDYKDAFILWRGLRGNYEGGVLNAPARVAIQLTHRVGAVLTAFALVFVAVSVLRRRALGVARPATIAVLVALALQLIIGISMVLLAFPLPLATAHNAGAAVLWLATLTLVRQLPG